MSTDEVLTEALRLPRRERARLAEELLSSLEESDEEVAAAWAGELEKRSREIAEGLVQTVGNRASADSQRTRAKACGASFILKASSYIILKSPVRLKAPFRCATMKADGHL